MNKLINTVSDILSFPARRNAQKAINQANSDVADIKLVRQAKGTDTSDKNYTDPLFRARANVAAMKQTNALKSMR